MRRAQMIMLIAVMAVLGISGAAQALVVSGGVNGQVGVAPVPGSVTVSSQAGSCSDPWLAADLGGPNVPLGGLCWHSGGSVLHGAETFAITWDPIRYDWATTRDYLEQYLRNVADSSNTLGSPYAVATQYQAANRHLYGGGCIDFGSTGGSTCRFPNAVLPAPGRDFPTAKGCPSDPKTKNLSYDPVGQGADPLTGKIPNCYLLTDSDIQHELSQMISDMGLVGRTQNGYTPLLAFMTPPGVEVCLDDNKTWCSANSDAASTFCSYHSFLKAGNESVAYVVQPWTAYTDCDPTNMQNLPTPPTAQELAIDVGQRTVSALSQGQIAAVTNPWLNGWSSVNGAEINDRCPRTDAKADVVTLGGVAYALQTEFNNAGLLETDPNAPGCALGVTLAPTFVPPSPISAGDVVAFDGSVTVSTLMVPQAGYHWDFGDNTTGTGASVVHSYAKGGTYKVTLTVTDRGNNTQSFSQTVSVLGPDGQPVTTPSGGGGQNPGLKAHMQLMPQGLKTVLRAGIAVRLTSNQRADGMATLTIPRRAAKQAKLSHGRAGSVVIGRGTIGGIKNGTIKLHLHLARGVAAKLRHLHHVAFTVRLTLFAGGGEHLTLDAAGRY